MGYVKIDTRCHVCQAVLSDEEIKNKECWNCEAIKATKDAKSEWNADDDEPLPNIIQR